jgi:hypothetical protein
LYNIGLKRTILSNLEGMIDFWKFFFMFVAHLI